MAIVNDQKNERVVDAETGQYITWKLADWQSNSYYFTLHDGDGTGILGSLVERAGIDETGNRGASTLLRFVLRQAWIPTGKPERPTYFYGSNPLIGRLAQFLEIYRHYSGVKTPDPRFEFVDARAEEGDRK
jgi:hypothetical protein